MKCKMKTCTGTGTRHKKLQQVPCVLKLAFSKLTQRNVRLALAVATTEAQALRLDPCPRLCSFDAAVTSLSLSLGLFDACMHAACCFFAHGRHGPWLCNYSASSIPSVRLTSPTACSSPESKINNQIISSVDSYHKHNMSFTWQLPNQNAAVTESKVHTSRGSAKARAPASRCTAVAGPLSSCRRITDGESYSEPYRVKNKSAGLQACLIRRFYSCFCSSLVLVPLFSCCVFLLRLNQGHPPPPSLFQVLLAPVTSVQVLLVTGTSAKY